MANSTKDSRHNVSLEELLRFKRTERPDEVFWEQFDSELHDRMMQTLVKKDPWYVQILRGLSGRFAQSTAIAAAAAVLALTVVRPAFVGLNGPSEPSEQNHSTLASTSAYGTSPGATKVTEPTEAPVNEIDRSHSNLMAEADYGIEVLSASAEDGNGRVRQDFGLDHLGAGSYDRTAYSADMTLPGVTSSGVASIVY